MNYSITLTGEMNARRDAKIIGYKMTDIPNNIIGILPVGARAEGDALSADGKWLNVLLIDGLQVTEPTYLATYTTSGKLVTNPPPDIIIPLPFQVGLNIVADSPLRLSLVNSDGTRTEVFTADMGEYVMEFIAADSNRPFIRMD